MEDNAGRVAMAPLHDEIATTDFELAIDESWHLLAWLFTCLLRQNDRLQSASQNAMLEVALHGVRRSTTLVKRAAFHCNR